MPGLLIKACDAHGRAALVSDVALGIMNDVIGPLADTLTTMPVGAEHPGRTAGAKFELIEDDRANRDMTMMTGQEACSH